MSDLTNAKKLDFVKFNSSETDLFTLKVKKTIIPLETIFTKPLNLNFLF